MQINFDNSYAQLPDRFFSKIDLKPVSDPHLIRINHLLAAELNLDVDWLSSEDGVAMLAGNKLPTGAEPIASVYAGHQFGNWNPQLGDGRALLLGEIVNQEQQRYDLQLKGSGPTPYSRGGDGRSPLGPVLREFLVSSAMHTLGVPTSRMLAAVSTGDMVQRENDLPGGIVTRVAKSHIRFGTFQYFAARNDIEALTLLTNHVIERHYPEAKDSDNPTLAMFQRVLEQQVELVAQWLSFGFIHGVMNTDNILLSGETIDYGPCAFMDEYHPEAVFSSIDQGSRYAFANQPSIMHWNLSAFGQAILPLLDEDEDAATEMAKKVLEQFPEKFKQAYIDRMARKLGFVGNASDLALIQELMSIMATEACDFTLTFRKLNCSLTGDWTYESGVPEDYELPTSLLNWIPKWHDRLEQDQENRADQQALMNSVNPLYIPRNHHIEACINAAVDQQDFTLFHQLAELYSSPFVYNHETRNFALPPAPDQVVQNTFCGT